MSKVGFREYTDFERPSQELVDLFKDIPVANIDDNMSRLYAIDGAIRPMNGVKMLGTAFTVKTTAGDNLMLHRALDIAKPGDVILVDGKGDMTRAQCGEIMVTYAMKRGLAGLVIDGCVRDADELREYDFPVYARGITPNGPYKEGPGEINVPVAIGGQVVFPGDIIIGDADGVVVVRPADATVVAANAKKQNEKEQNNLKQIEEGTFDRSWIVKTLEAKGCTIE